MKKPAPLIRFALLFPLLALWVSGCTTMDERRGRGFSSSPQPRYDTGQPGRLDRAQPRSPMPQTQPRFPDQQRLHAEQDQLIAQEAMIKIRSRLEAQEAETIRLRQELQLTRQNGDAKAQAERSAMRRQIDQLTQRLSQAERTRERDKAELIDKMKKVIMEAVNTRNASVNLPRTPTRPPAPTPVPDPGSGEFWEHEVKSGETLSVIAQAYGVKTSAIVRANKMRSADVLKIGQQLLIPIP